MSTARGSQQRRFYGSSRCKFCNKCFNNNRAAYQHESSHDFFSCIHCMKLLKAHPLAKSRTLPTSSASSSSSYPSTHTTPRLLITIDNCNNPNPHHHTTTISNAASSNRNTNHNSIPRKRKYHDLEPDSNPSHEPPPPLPKRPRLSTVKPSNILNLVSDEEEESSLSSEFTDGDLIAVQPTTQTTAAKDVETSDSNTDIITAYKQKIKQSKQENEDDTGSEDIEILPPRDTAKPSKQPPKDDSEDDVVIVMPLPASHATNNDDTPSTASNSSNEWNTSEILHVIDWKQLDFEQRNPAHRRLSFYQNINRNILSQLLHKSIGAQISQDIQQTRPNDTELKLKQFLVEFVVHKITVLMKDRKYFKRRQKKNEPMDYSQFVHLYGSLASKIDSAQCDVDIAIDIPHFVEPKSFLRQLANILQKHTIKQGKKFKIERIFNAKVPILKLTDPLYKIEADISIYKSHDLSVKYINGLLDYNGDKRIRQLLIAIKHWSKKRNINCAMTGKINSFGFTILVLKYLQCICIPVLPVMDWTRYDISEQEIERITASDAYQQRCKDDPLYKYYTSSYEYHSMRLMPSKTTKSGNDMAVSELLYGFFEFYSNFDFEHNQISLHSHSVQTKQTRNYAGFTMDQMTFVIQDPIEIKNNCAKNVRPHTAELLVNEFKRAQFILLYGGDWIHDVCADITLQPNCFDVVTLSTEALYYKQHERNLKHPSRVEHVQQYVVDKAITCEDMYYGYYRNDLNRKKQARKKKKKRKKSRQHYLRRTNSY